MKQYFMNLFEIEPGDYNLKDVLRAAGSLILAIMIVFLPLYL